MTTSHKNGLPKYKYNTYYQLTSEEREFVVTKQSNRDKQQFNNK